MNSYSIKLVKKEKTISMIYIKHYTLYRFNHTAIIQSDYLKDTEEDVSDDYEKLNEKQDMVNETIDSVADISSATAPSFSKVTSNAEEAVKVITDLEEKLDSFTSTGDTSQTKDLLHQIEVTMKNAKINDGTARFTDYKGDSKNVGLAKLKDYNQGKMVEEMEKAKEAKDSVLQDQNKPSSRAVVNKAYQEFKDGDITYDRYTAILNSVKNTSGNMNEEELKENTTESFIEYLEDRGMLEQYLEDHQTWAEYAVKKMPETLWKHGEGYLPIFLKKSGVSRKELADYLKESDKDITSRMKIEDPNFTKEVNDTYKQADRLSKYAKFAKGAGKALGWAGVGFGFYDDVAKNDKTVGEAAAHTGATLAIGGTIALAFPPGGVAPAVGLGATAAFEYLYTQNTFGIQDKLDKAGEKLSKWGKAAGDFLKNPGESIASGLSAVNPFA